MLKNIKVNNISIGISNPVFIIAEAGVNHDGNINKAKLLIDIAKDAKADAVKFQTWITEDLILESTKKAKYQKKQDGDIESQFQMIKKLELAYSEFIELKKYCDMKGIMFISTPDEVRSANFLNDLQPIFKVGSGEFNNISLLKIIARFDKPMIISTGISNMDEIIRIKKWVEEEGNSDLIFLHCTTDYPAPLEDVNMAAMLAMKNDVGTLVGYSDHTEGIEASIVAVLNGACVIEKHFTYDNDANGPDHKASLNPDELKKMVNIIRAVESMNENEKEDYKKNMKNYSMIMGSYKKIPSNRSKEIAKVITKYVISRNDIKKGEKFNENNLTVLRANDGDFTADNFFDIIGKNAKNAILKNNIIKREDVG